MCGGGGGVSVSVCLHVYVCVHVCVRVLCGIIQVNNFVIFVLRDKTRKFKGDMDRMGYGSNGIWIGFHG